jgi:hypothetical protein
MRRAPSLRHMCRIYKREMLKLPDVDRRDLVLSQAASTLACVSHGSCSASSRRGRGGTKEDAGRGRALSGVCSRYLQATRLRANTPSPPSPLSSSQAAAGSGVGVI